MILGEMMRKNRPTERFPNIEPQRQQDEAIKKSFKQIKAFVKDLPDLGKIESNLVGSAGANDDYDVRAGSEESFATFAIFGPRGSGKSTVLEQLCWKISESGEKIEGAQLVWPPLDCTTLPLGIPLSISLISYILDWVELQMDKSQASLKEDFERSRLELLESFLPIDAGYRELRLSLAVTSSEYGEIAIRELRARQSIRNEVAAWIEGKLPHFFSAPEQEDFKCLIVPLDDFDLASGEFTSRELATFLHDLSSSRIVFVLVTDREHLTHRFSQEVSGITGDTKERLLEKLIPTDHRFNLSPWLTEGGSGGVSPRSFKPLAHSSEQQDAEVPPLFELLEKTVDKLALSCSPEIFAALLPRLPRGLTSFYRRLNQICGSVGEEAEAGKGLKYEQDALEELLSTLAQCRGEEGVARVLALRPLDWWAAKFAARLEDSSLTTWKRIVAEAKSEAPISALEPAEKRPLDFPEGEDDALWVELLLNLAGQQSSDFLPETFLEKVIPVKKRVQLCNLELKVEPSLRDFFVSEIEGKESDSETTNAKLFASPWFRFLRNENASKAGFGLRVGWSCMARDDDPTYPRTLLWASEMLGIPYVPVKQQADRSTLVPADVRSLIILIDKISALPWVEIQDWAKYHFSQDLLSILALLCGSAYFKALDDRLDLPELESKPPDIDFKDLRALGSKELRAQLATMRAYLAELEECDDYDATHPMAEATRAYFDGPWLTDLLAEPAAEDEDE